MAVPGIPTSVVVSASEAGVTIQWAPPAATPSPPLTNYIVQWAITNAFTGMTAQSSMSLPAGARGWTVNGVLDKDGNPFPKLGVVAWVRVAAGNSDGLSAYVSGSATPGPLSPLGTKLPANMSSVADASVFLPGVAGGTTVFLENDLASLTGADTGIPVIGLAYSRLADIGYNIPGPFLSIGYGSTSLYPSRDPQAYALVADAANNLYVLGAKGSDRNSLLVMKFTYNGLTGGIPSWTFLAADAQSMAQPASPGDEFNPAIGKVSATFVPGSGAVPKDVLFALIRRVGASQGGINSYATVDLSAFNTPAALFIRNGTNPGFLPTPVATSTDDAGKVGVVLTAANTIAAVGERGVGTAVVVNGVVSTVYETTLSGLENTGFARLVGKPTGEFILIYSGATGNLSFRSYTVTATQIGASPNLAAATAFGGAFGNLWDATYNRVTGNVEIYYVAAASARTVSMVEYNPVTGVVGTPVVLTSSYGAASSTNYMLRTPRTPSDERKVVITGATSTAASVAQATPYLGYTGGNVAPSSPAPGSRPNFDAAVVAAVFPWTFSDANTYDVQSAFQLQIIRVSDGVTVHDTGKVTSAVSSRTVAAGTLANGVAYVWQVRTYDALDVVGPYSPQQAFSTAATGTAAWVFPATDGTSPDTSSLALVWSYTSSGPTQAQRRVRLYRTDTGALVSDTGMQANTTLGYTLTGLQSGVPYRTDLDLINSGSVAVPQISRTFTPVFDAPMTPTFTATPAENYIRIEINNPTPSGSRPEVVRNVIYRMLDDDDAGPTTLPPIAEVGYNGVYYDREVAAGVAYAYWVGGIAASGYGVISLAVGATGPALTGPWIHLVSDPAGTEGNFIYQDSERGENLAVNGALLSFVGRTFPVADFGTQESHEMALAVRIPWDEGHDYAVTLMRMYERARSTLCYRDNRGRLLYGVILELSVMDATDAGSIVEFTLSRVDHTAEITLS